MTKRAQIMAAAGGLLVLLALVVLDPHIQGGVRLLGTREAIDALQGETERGDFAADWIGARRLLEDRDPYPVLGDAWAEEGIDWRVAHRNPHPPSAFVLALPVGRADYGTAAAVWGWLQLGLLVASAILLRVPAWVALAGSPLLLFWPPTAFSVGQTTAVWLAGLAVARRSQHRPFLAGVAVAFAALPKGAAALVLLPLARQRGRVAVAGFAAVGVTTTLLLLALDADVLHRWLEAAMIESGVQIPRDDNGAPLAVAGRLLGAFGTGVAAVAIVAAAVVAARRGRAWDAAAWAAVALLPVAWIYSLVPLLIAMRHRWLLALTVAGAALVPPFGPSAAAVVCLFIVGTGVALFLPAPERRAPTDAELGDTSDRRQDSGSGRAAAWPT